MEAVLLVQFLQEAVEKGQHIPRPLPQGRDGDRYHVETIEQVFPEGLGAHHFGQVPVGGGDDSDIHGNGAGAAHPLDLTLLEHPQQLDLHIQGQLPNLVQEDGALVRQLERAHLSMAAGPGKGPLLIAEQFALYEGRRDGAAVDGEEPLLPPDTVLIDIVSELLLAHSGLSGEQHGGVQGGHPVHLTEDGQGVGIGGDQVGTGELPPGQLQLGAVAFRRLPVLLLQVVILGHVPYVGDHHHDLPVRGEVRGAGDQCPFACAEGLLQGDGLPLGDGQQGTRLADDAAALQVPHAFAHHVLLPQTADGQVGRVDP